ncbi:MAG: NAD(P)H-dependent oxidoreductase subunit E [Chloroflexi bacterium]|nr:NAD(P)H-dependent oxidoreductase subunit E [Chloroflexota bacterium]
MTLIADKYAEEIEGILGRFPHKKSAALPLMHLAQREYGYMSEDAMREVAGILDLDPTHILSLAGFYSLFHEEPTGKYVLEICNDLACALRGADEFVDMVCHKLDIPLGGTTDDGLFTVRGVMCLGACDRAPMLQYNLKFAEHLDEEKFDSLIAYLREEAASGETGISGEEKPSVVEKIAAYAKKS